MNLPKRSSQHKTESESLALLRAQLGSDWVFRDQQDRDYGVDVHLELFDGETPTGLVLYGQLKGTSEKFEDEVTLNGFPTKTANYANLFAIPFFVFFASTSSHTIKFIWLQEYLRLNIRSRQLSQQESITIKFPPENTLTEHGRTKIDGILRKQRLHTSALKFITHYERLINHIDSLKSNHKDASKHCLIQLLEIKNLALVPQKYDERDLSSCDFEAATNLLNAARHRGLATKEEIHFFEAKILPLKIKKLELLNLDTQDAIGTWLTGMKHY